MASLSSTRYVNASCPLDSTSGYAWPTFLTASATSCGATPCCTFRPLAGLEYTWQSVSKQPVTVGTEVVIIDTALGITTTTTELITTGIVVTLPDRRTPTTLDPSQWLSGGVFDPGYDVPTRSTILTDRFDNLQTIRYPSGYVDVEAELSWYGSIPIVSAGTTSCYQNTADVSPIASPTYISTTTQTVDPTDPKGIFYQWGAKMGIQMPACSSGTCGGVLASELLQSWRSTDLIVSVYSSCLGTGVVPLPATPLNTASFLLASTTRFARVEQVATTTSTAQKTTSTSRAAPVEPVPGDHGGSTPPKQPEQTPQPAPNPKPEQTSRPAPKPAPEPVRQTISPPAPIVLEPSRTAGPVDTAPDSTDEKPSPPRPKTQPGPEPIQQTATQPKPPSNTAGMGGVDTPPSATDADADIPAPQQQTRPAPEPLEPSPTQLTPPSGTVDLGIVGPAPESTDGDISMPQSATRPVPGAPLQTATGLVRPSSPAGPGVPDDDPESAEKGEAAPPVKSTKGGDQAEYEAQSPPQPTDPSRDGPTQEAANPGDEDSEQTLPPVFLASDTPRVETRTSSAGIGDIIAGVMGETKATEVNAAGSTAMLAPSGGVAGSGTAGSVPAQYTGMASRSGCEWMVAIVLGLVICF